MGGEVGLIRSSLCTSMTVKKLIVIYSIALMCKVLQYTAFVIWKRN